MNVLRYPGNILIAFLSLMPSVALAQTLDPANPFGVPPIDMASMHDMSIRLFFVMLVGFGGWSLYKKKLSLGLLLLISAMSASWQEFYGDWGSYLYWNPGFPQLPWGESPFTTPVKPMFIPFSWGWYFALIYTFLAVLLMWVQRKLPMVPKWLVVLAIAGPLFYAYNISGEKTAADMAWWGYAHSFGPYAEGTYANYPLIWPNVALTTWSVVLLWMLTLKDNAGYWWHERVLGVNRVGAGVKHGLARLGAFMLMFNISCLLIVTLPCMIVRLIWGVESAIVP
ncbi:MAG: hypothetical protein CMK32_03185 [Porticoccaceae bacterium]|nr:hypothetical protein [Porticoccaceae bacterium]